MATPFANKTELAAYWRPLTPAEESRADIMFDIASNRLRLMGKEVNVNVQSKFNNEDDYKSTVKWVVMEAVKRALSTPTDQPPVDQWQQTAGPYSQNYKYTNPSGDLWFKKSELRAIELYGRQTLSAIKTSIKDIYS